MNAKVYIKHIEVIAVSFIVKLGIAEDDQNPDPDKIIEQICSIYLW